MRRFQSDSDAQKRERLHLLQGTWHVPHSQLRYLHAGLRNRTKVAGIAWARSPRRPERMEAALEALGKAGGRMHRTGVRTFMLRSGHRAGSKFFAKGEPDEQLDLQTQFGLSGEVAD